MKLIFLFIFLLRHRLNFIFCIGLGFIVILATILARRCGYALEINVGNKCHIHQPCSFVTVICCQQQITFQACSDILEKEKSFFKSLSYGSQSQDGENGMMSPGLLEDNFNCLSTYVIQLNLEPAWCRSKACDFLNEANYSRGLIQLHCSTSDRCQGNVWPITFWSSLFSQPVFCL